MSIGRPRRRCRRRLGTVRDKARRRRFQRRWNSPFRCSHVFKLYLNIFVCLCPEVDKLQAHISDNLQSQLKGLDDENRHLQSRIAFFEKDTEDLLAQNEELERTMEEVKKKMNCTIS